MSYRALLYLLEAQNGVTPAQKEECLRRATVALMRDCNVDPDHNPTHRTNLLESLGEELQRFPLTPTT
jgi:hypothetical protein